MFFLWFIGEVEGFCLSGSDGCNNLMGGYDVGDYGMISFFRVVFIWCVCLENGDINVILIKVF